MKCNDISNIPNHYTSRYAADVHISLDRILLVLNAFALVQEMKYDKMHANSKRNEGREITTA